MTITYSREVSTCSGLGVFWKLLFRWKGSIYKLVWHNLLLYVILYFALSFTYRLLLNEYGREKFELISVHCNRFADLIPVTFVLGFYVSIVITRWWSQYTSIPWPDPCCLFISTCILGNDERGRLMRRTIARYLIVALVQTLRMTSIVVKKRFPTLQHMSDAGILTDNERMVIESLDEKCIQHPKYWMSLVWAGAIVTRAKKEGRITDPFAFQTIITEINKFRRGCGGLLDYDWISIPLVYTQVVTLAVYTFFLSSLMGRQFLDSTKGLEGHTVDLVVPVFTFLQFFFYMGWLKVAEALINPFGEDDDDFEMNWLIDRDLQVAYLIVDDMHAEHPELVKDQFWDEGIPDELPYTVAAEEFRTDPWLGSTAEVEVSQEQGEFVNFDKIEEEEEDLEPGSDDELNQVRIEDVKTTVPIKIAKNGGLMHIGSMSSMQESMVTLPTSLAPKSAKTGSVMSMLQKIFSNNGSTSNSRVNMHRIGSDASVTSKVSKPRGRRRKPKIGRQSCIDKSHSLASNMTTHSPVMSRIQTNENEIFKMSETSSVNSDSEGPTRSNSEAQALKDVRDRLRQDLQRYQGVQGSQGGLKPMEEQQSQLNSRSTGGSRHRKRSESRTNSALLRHKLQEVLREQALIIQELDDEMRKQAGVEDDVQATQELITNISSKTQQLRTALEHSRAAGTASHNNSFRRMRSDSEGETRGLGDMETSPGHGDRGMRLVIHPGTHGSQAYSSPSSPANKGPIIGHPMEFLHSSGIHPPIKPISAMSTKSCISVQSGSDHSLADIVFDLDKQKEEVEEGDTESTSLCISNTGTVKEEEVTSWETEEEETPFPGTLDPIQELPEIGYQSDGSDTDLLLPRYKRKEKYRGQNQQEGDTHIQDTGGLPTVQEDTD